MWLWRKKQPITHTIVCRYMSVALRSNAPVRPSLRRTASLENFLDKNRGDDQIELRKTTLDNKDGTTSNKAGGGQSSSTTAGGSRKYTHQSRSSSRTAAAAPCAPKTRASRESIKRSVCTTSIWIANCCIQLVFCKYDYGDLHKLGNSIAVHPGKPLKIPIFITGSQLTCQFFKLF